MDELDMERLYQQLVLRKREVELEMKFKGPSPTNNNLAIQLHAKINNKNHSKSAGMMAMACTNEVNIAHVANYGDLCRHVLCRGKRKSAKHLWSECRRNPNNKQNIFQPNNAGTKYDRGNRHGFSTNQGGNKFPGSSINVSNNIIKSGSNPSRFGGKQNFTNNPNYRGSGRKDGKSATNFRGDNKFPNKYNNSTSRNNYFKQGIKDQS